MNSHSNLNDPEFAAILVAVLVKRLGGKVEIKQSDIDEVAYNQLKESGHKGSLEFSLIERKVSA